MAKDISRKIYNDALSKTSKDITIRLQNFGFVKTKKWQWVRVKEGAANFVHVHTNGSSYSSPINYSVSFRVHCGNRLLSDTFDALALNGPNSDRPQFSENRYHLRFNAKSGSTYERCIDDIERFVQEAGEPWFKEQEATRQENTTQASNESSYKLPGVKIKNAP